MITIGYKASAEQFAPRALLDYAVRAEANGFDSCFVSDHFQPWRHTDGHAPFSFAWLAALGERTRRMVLGTSVVTPTFRYHPAVVAQAVATLAALQPGRIVLGVGTGEALNEVPATGMPWPGFREREARLRESIMLMRRLWREERVSHAGEFYRTERATVYDRPAPMVPIYIGAAGPKAAQMAGALGDGFITTSGKPMALYEETLLPNVRAGNASAGRTDGYAMMMEIKLSFDTDRAAALDATRHWAALALSAEEKQGIDDPVELERRADALPIERAASRWIVTDDADEAVERILPYVRLGFTHLVFHAPGPDQARFLDLFAAHVAPRLRAAG